MILTHISFCGTIKILPSKQHLNPLVTYCRESAIKHENNPTERQASSFVGLWAAAHFSVQTAVFQGSESWLLISSGH